MKPSPIQTATSAGYAATYNPIDQTATWKPAGSGTTTTFGYADADSTERTTNGTDNWADSPLGLSFDDQGSYRTSWTRDPSGTLISQYRTTTGKYDYYLNDAQGSIVGIINDTGTITDRYRYDAYGNPTYTSGTTPNPWRYTAGYQDDTTSLKLGTRYYNPTNGRFTQTDPILSQPRYQYTANDPINHTDPTGRIFGIDCPFGETDSGGCNGASKEALGTGLSVAGTAVGVAAIFASGGTALALGAGSAALGTAGAGLSCGATAAVGTATLSAATAGLGYAVGEAGLGRAGAAGVLYGETVGGAAIC